MMSEPLWKPTRDEIAATNTTAFIHAVNERWNAAIHDYPGLYRFSIDDAVRFWESVWSFGGVIASRQPDCVVSQFDRMPGTRWFEGARLNFAQNLLRHALDEQSSDRPAIVFW